MKEFLQTLTNGQHLGREEAKKLILLMTNGNAKASLISSILTAYNFLSPNLEEIKGFREALYERTEFIDLSDYNPMDMCGTGGDGKDTFNISTLSAIVVSSFSIPIAKHGNYGSSSVCGSSNVLEYLGYNFKQTPKEIKEEMDKNQLCFIHAPHFHSCLRHVAPVRKSLGIKTIFNLLGPLVNPCQPKIQCSGVYNLDVLRQYHYLLQESHEKHSLVHSLDGYDEITLTGKFKLLTSEEELLLQPDDLELSTVYPKDIKGGKTIKESAAIFTKILQGKGSARQNSVVAINSAVAMHCYKPEQSITQHYEYALESLRSGKPYQKLRKSIYA